jgi:PAS domain S-box-containing protein
VPDNIPRTDPSAPVGLSPLYRSVFAAAPDGMLLLDPDTHHAFDFNDAACAHLGYTREEFGRLRIADYDARESPEDVAERIRTALRDGEIEFDTVHRTKSGTLRDVHVWAKPVRHESRTVLLTIFRDITAQRRAEQAQRLQSAALRAAANAIVITDRAGRIEWVNPAFTELTGYSFDEAIGRNPGELVNSGHHPADFFADFWQTILAGRPWRGEMVNRRKDGTLYEEDQSVTPILDRTGAVSHFVSVKQDVSGRRRLEAQYRQAQRMEVVGQLASGIAHDFNNLLTVINGLSDLLLQQADAQSPLEADLQEIRRAGERAATLTRQLLAFSRQQVQTLEVLDLNALVAGIERLLRRLVGEDVQLVVVASPDLRRVKADPGQLEQVITNLVVNARDAMPSGGRLTIETQNAWIDEAWAREHRVTSSPGPYVTLVVSDSGVGMDAATRARIFEPFFTTKGPGKGTGLGLSTVYGIVKQTGGFVWVYSEPGQGTTFRIHLPAAAENATSTESSEAEVERSGTETVLLVEDNDELRAWTRRVLETAGYVVRAAADADEAERLFLEAQEPVELLLTDVVMPGRNGRHLAEDLTKVSPALRVLYMSGYTNDTVVRHGVLEGTMSFIGKPFNAPTLLKAVRRTLDG